MFPVEFDPPPPHQRESVGFRQQLPDLGGSEGFAVERDIHTEIEQGFMADTRGRLTADRTGHAGPRRTVSPPCRRHTDDHARCFQLWNVPQELQRFLGRPPQRMKDLARVHHGLQPRASFRRSLYRNEQ